MSSPALVRCDTCHQELSHLARFCTRCGSAVDQNLAWTLRREVAPGLVVVLAGLAVMAIVTGWVLRAPATTPAGTALGGESAEVSPTQTAQTTRNYVTAVAPGIDVMQQGTQLVLADCSSAPTSDDCLVSLQQMLRLSQNWRRALDQLDPPESVRPVHTELQTAADLYIAGTQHSVTGVQTHDNALISTGTQEFDEARAHLNQASTLLEGLPAQE